MAESSTILSVRGLTKIIKGRTIVDHADFDLISGEVFGLLGPNGAGKSTTIKMLVGLMNRQSGEVHYKGEPLTHNSAKLREHIGSIVENPDLYGHLTGRQNLKLFAQMYNNVSMEKALECARLTKIDQALDKKFKNYSLGMKQRLGIAVALLNDPDILILDEPTNGLDPAGIHDTRVLVRELAQSRGISVLVSSHILSEMQLMCDRVAIMNQGKIITIQTVESLMETTMAEHGRYTIEVAEMEPALDVLRQLGCEVTPQGRLINVVMPREDYTANDLLHALLDRNFTIIRINPAGGQTLEEAFMRLTAGGVIQ